MYGIDTSKIFTAGYSYGGGAMITAAIHNPEVNKLVSIAGADLSGFIRMLKTDQQFRNSFEEKLRNLSGEKAFAKIEGDVESYIDQMIKNVDYYDPVKNAESLSGKEILFIVGWDDVIGKIEENALPLYRRLKELRALNVQIKAFTDDHSFNKSRDELAKTIIEWIKMKN